MKALPHKYSRFKRLFLPRQNDHSAWLLINAVGRYWLLFRGFKREYPVEYAPDKFLYIDLAHPRKKIAIEADGRQYHMDIVKEQWRNDTLEKLGWFVLHYRYSELKKHPGSVRHKVRGYYGMM